MSSLVVLASDENELHEIDKRLSKDGMRGDLTVEHKLRYVWRLVKRSENSLKSSLDDITILKKQQDQDMAQVENYVSHIQELSNQQKLLMNDYEKENDILKDEVNQLQEERGILNRSLEEIQQLLDKNNLPEKDISEPRCFLGEYEKQNETFNRIAEVQGELFPQFPNNQESNFEDSRNQTSRLKNNVDLVQLKKEIQNLQTLKAEHKEIEEIINAEVDITSSFSSKIKSVLCAKTEENLQLRKENQMISNTFDEEYYADHIVKGENDLSTLEKVKCLQELYRNQTELLENVKGDLQKKDEELETVSRFTDRPCFQKLFLVSKNAQMEPFAKLKLIRLSYEHQMEELSQVQEELKKIKGEVNTINTTFVSQSLYSNKDIFDTFKDWISSHECLQKDLESINEERNLMQSILSKSTLSPSLSITDQLKQLVEQYNKQIEISKSFEFSKAQLCERLGIEDNLLWSATVERIANIFRELELHVNNTKSELQNIQNFVNSVTKTLIYSENLENLTCMERIGLLKNHCNAKDVELEKIKCTIEHLDCFSSNSHRKEEQKEKTGILTDIKTLVRNYEKFKANFEILIEEKLELEEIFNLPDLHKFCEENTSSKKLSEKLKTLATIYQQQLHQLDYIEKESEILFQQFPELLSQHHNFDSIPTFKGLVKSNILLQRKCRELLTQKRDLDLFLNSKRFEKLEEITGSMDTFEKTIMLLSSYIKCESDLSAIKMEHAKISDILSAEDDASTVMADSHERSQFENSKDLQQNQTLDQQSISQQHQQQQQEEQHRQQEQEQHHHHQQRQQQEQEQQQEQQQQQKQHQLQQQIQCKDQEQSCSQQQIQRTQFEQQLTQQNPPQESSTIDEFVEKYKKLKVELNILKEEKHGIVKVLSKVGSSNTDENNLSLIDSLQIFVDTYKNFEKTENCLHQVHSQFKANLISLEPPLDVSENPIENIQTLIKEYEISRQEMKSLKTDHDRIQDSICEKLKDVAPQGAKDLTKLVDMFIQKYTILEEQCEVQNQAIHGALNSINSTESSDPNLIHQLEQSNISLETSKEHYQHGITTRSIQNELSKLDTFATFYRESRTELHNLKNERDLIAEIVYAVRVPPSLKERSLVETVQDLITSFQEKDNQLAQIRERYKELDNVNLRRDSKILKAKTDLEHLDALIVDYRLLQDTLQASNEQLEEITSILNAPCVKNLFNKEPETCHLEKLQILISSYQEVLKQLNNAKQEVEWFRCKQSDLEKMMSALNDDLQIEQNTLHKLQTVHEELKIQFERKNKECLDLSQQLKDIKSTTKIQKDDLEAAKTELELYCSLKTLHEKLIKELEEKTNECCILTKTVEELEYAIESQENNLRLANLEIEEFHNLQSSHEEMSIKLQRKVEECSNMSRKLENFEQAMRVQENDLQEATKDLGKFYNLQHEHEEMSKDLQEKNEECSEISMKLEHLQQVMESQKVNLQECKNELEKFKNLKSEHKKISTAFQEKNEECSELSKKLKDLGDAMKIQEDDLKEAKKELEKFKKLQSHYEEKSKELQHKIEECSEISRKLKELDHTTKIQDDNIKKAKKEFENLQREHKETLKALQEKNEECSEMSRALKELYRVTKIQEGKLQEAKKELDKFRNLQNRHEEKSKELQLKTEECSEMSTKIEYLEQALKTQHIDLQEAKIVSEEFYNLQREYEEVSKVFQQKNKECIKISRKLKDLDHVTEIQEDDLQEAKKLQKLQSHYEENSNELQQKIDEYSELSLKLKELEKQTKKDSEAYKSLHSTHKETSNELEDQLDECSSLKKALNDLQNANREAKEDGEKEWKKQLERFRKLQIAHGELSKSFQEKVDENLHLLRRLEEFEQSTKIQNSSLKSTEAKLHDFKILHEELKTQLQSKVQELSEVSKKLVDKTNLHQQEQEDTSVAIEDTKRSYRNLQRDHNLLQTKYQAKSDELSNISEELQEIEAMLLKKKKEKIDLTKHNNELKNNLESLSSTTEELRNQLNTQRLKYEQEIEDFTKSLKDEVQRKVENLQKIEMQHHQLEEMVKTMKTEKASLEKENHSIKKQNASIQAAHNDLLRSLERDHQSAIEMLESHHHDSIKQMRSKHENETSKLRNQLEFNEKEIETLKLKVKLTSKKKKEMDKSLSASTSDMEFMKMKIDLLHNEKQQLDSQLKMEQEKLESLEKETKELSSANKIMKNEISAIKEEFLTHKEAMHTMKMKLKKKNAEIKENQFNFQQLEDSYHKQINHLQETNGIQEQVLSQLKLELEYYQDLHGELLHKSNTEVSTFKQQAEDESKRSKQVQHQAKRMKTQYSQLKNTLKEAVEELHQL